MLKLLESHGCKPWLGEAELGVPSVALDCTLPKEGVLLMAKQSSIYTQRRLPARLSTLAR